MIDCLVYADWGFWLFTGKWGISVFIVLLIRSSTVLACALFELARTGQNPWGIRYAAVPASE